MRGSRRLVDERDRDNTQGRGEFDRPSFDDIIEFLQGHRTYLAAGLVFIVVASVGCALLLSLSPIVSQPMLRRTPLHPQAPHKTAQQMPSGPFWLGAPTRLWQTAPGTASGGSPALIEQQVDVLVVPNFDFDGPVISISATTGQTIAGFGGALSEASARVFRELPSDQQQNVLEGYFGPDGIGYTLGRVDINGDFNADHFDEDISSSFRVEVPLVKAVQSMLTSQGITFRLLATQRSAPAWMQTNSRAGSIRRPCLRTDVSLSWARYFVRWITALKNKDVPIWAVTVQHELKDAAGLEACLLAPEEEADFLGNLFGPALRSAHPDILVFYSDHFKDHLHTGGNLIESHPTAALYADGLAFQTSSDSDLEAALRMHKILPGAQMLASQAVGVRQQWRWHEGATVEHGQWTLGEDYARDIADDLNAGSVGWIDWNLLINEEKIGPNHIDDVWDAAMNLILEEGDGSRHMDNVWDAAMMADLSTGKVHRHPQYYFIGHFSKFIPRGSIHLKSTIINATQAQQSQPGNTRKDGEASGGRRKCSTDGGLSSTSFLRPDKFVATVVLNCRDEDLHFKLQDGPRAIRASIPAHAIQTYLFEDKGSSPFRPPGAGHGVPFIGANLGGWLVLEEWMWALEMTQQGIKDEHGFILQHGGPLDPRAVSQMMQHWDEFVKEEDLDQLQRFGVTHIRVPIGWWLVDYDPNDGFVDGGERYLFRLLGWLQVRGMRVLLDLHALPGAQATYESFTGIYSERAGFFEHSDSYERGKQAMVKLAELILSYEAHPMTTGVVFGMELANEPAWANWDTSPGIREMYEDMVPKLRQMLPASRYALFLSFMESPRTVGPRWLAKMRASDPSIWESVIYDAHLYHSYGDDNKPGRAWNDYVDSCKTCCRDPQILAPLVEAHIPMSVGEYSLNTGLPGTPEFYTEYLRNQLSLWASTPGMVGSFFWNHRILREKGGWFKEMSLLDLIAPTGPLPPISQMNFSVLCPGKDLTKCPKFDPTTVLWTDSCIWDGNPDLSI